MNRRLSQIKDLPISELSDEEITKAAMHRLKSKGIILGYVGNDNRMYWFTRWKNARGKYIVTRILEPLRLAEIKLKSLKKFKNGPQDPSTENKNS